ncbi:hypothetical protein VSS74_14030 [Conexibacter stalactiti]|uniref:Secreted protein n=1 Tax=Conexibacter stalactiti TaxID=1940611 RepID=A0ABU4HQG0_9ACTN|nr:hypothetical protein [Conexibacter stalactiti]MDW5595464.1 hypothetical protein [Conexibacter stalactiti]MEC5036106.1 hypothetical protein [Conexibacter stalactiti]
MRSTLKFILATTTAIAMSAPSLLTPGAAVAADYGPDTCLAGFVWREAFVGDTVCVPPATRTQTWADNAAAASRIDPNGAYGPRTCISPFVWREARPSDLVCVPVATRTQTKIDNALATSRRNSVLARLMTWAPTGDGVLRHVVFVSNVNVGRTYLGLYRSGNPKPIAWWYLNARATSGHLAGVAIFRTSRLVCNGAPNGYFRAKDMTSGRWSVRKPVRTGCSTL